jgi:hypothetical protein
LMASRPPILARCPARLLWETGRWDSRQPSADRETIFSPPLSLSLSLGFPPLLFEGKELELHQSARHDAVSRELGRVNNENFYVSLQESRLRL